MYPGGKDSMRKSAFSISRLKMIRPSALSRFRVMLRLLAQ